MYSQFQYTEHKARVVLCIVKLAIHGAGQATCVFVHHLCYVHVTTCKLHVRTDFVTSVTSEHIVIFVHIVSQIVTVRGLKSFGREVGEISL